MGTPIGSLKKQARCAIGPASPLRCANSVSRTRSSTRGAARMESQPSQMNCAVSFVPRQPRKDAPERLEPPMLGAQRNGRLRGREVHDHHRVERVLGAEAVEIVAEALGHRGERLPLADETPRRQRARGGATAIEKAGADAT